MENTAGDVMEMQGEGMSEVARVWAIFMEPSKTLADVARRPSWVVPLLVGLILVVIPMAIHPTRVDLDARIKAQVEQAQKFASGSDPAQLQEIMRKQADSWWGKYGTIISVVAFGTIATLAVAGILLLAFMLTGASLGFKKSLSAYCWSAIPPTLLLSALAVVFLYIKPVEDLNPLDPFANVMSNLSFLVSQKAQPVLYGILGSIDILSFWRIYLLGLAYAAISMGSLTAKKATGVVIVLWVLYVLVKAGFGAIFA